jgi:hypothetical protein
MFKNHNKKAIKREFLFLKTQKMKLKLRMKIINRDSKIKNQEEGADMIIRIIIQAKGKSDMFRNRKMSLKNLIKTDISRPKRVLISNISLISKIVGSKIVVDTNNEVATKEVMEVRKVAELAMKVAAEAITIIIVTLNKSKIIGK